MEPAITACTGNDIAQSRGEGYFTIQLYRAFAPVLSGFWFENSGNRMYFYQDAYFIFLLRRMSDFCEKSWNAQVLDKQRFCYCFAVKMIWDLV